MKRIATPILAAAVSVGIAACGSSGATTTATGSSQAPSAATSPSTTTTASQAPSGAKQQSEQLITQAQRLVRRMGQATGQLSTGNSTQVQQARAELARLQTQARSLSTSATQRLSPSNPARTVIVQVTQQAEAYATKLRTTPINATTRKAMANARTGLDGLATTLGQARAVVQKANLSKITSDLGTLANQLGITNSSSSSTGGASAGG